MKNRAAAVFLRRISSMKALFTDPTQVNNYALYRPDYSNGLYTKIIDYANQNMNSKLETAVDIGTGTGQVALKLTELCGHVIGLDTSDQQLEVARQLWESKSALKKSSSILKFAKGSSEKTNLEMSSTNLITVAQALHWFDLDLFYPEAHRILKPNGTLAIWGYDKPIIEADSGNELKAKKATEILHRMFDCEPVGPFWDVRRQLVYAELRGCEPTPPLFSQLQRYSLSDAAVRPVRSLEAVGGYMRSWSAYAACMRHHGWETDSEQDPARTLVRGLQEVFEVAEEPVELRLAFPVFLLLATRQP